MDNTQQQSLNDFDDTASQGSARSTGRSLLERIQAQREREAAAAAAAAATSNTFVPNQTQQSQQPTPQQINIPNYGESMASNAMGSSSMMNTVSLPENSNFFSSAWNNISSSMESGMAYHQQQQEEQETNIGDNMEDALLAPSGTHRYGASTENYSMTSYFTTFVNDVYGLFLRLPVPARIVTVVLLLYIALKLL
jgi:hypothetical protein